MVVVLIARATIAPGWHHFLFGLSKLLTIFNLFVCFVWSISVVQVASRCALDHCHHSTQATTIPLLSTADTQLQSTTITIIQWWLKPSIVGVGCEQGVVSKASLLRERFCDGGAIALWLPSAQAATHTRSFRCVFLSARGGNTTPTMASSDDLNSLHELEKRLHNGQEAVRCTHDSAQSCNGRARTLA